MSWLLRLIAEIHRRSLWQVLLIYIGAAWACFELIDAVANRLGLPAWLPGLAIVLFLLGLPFVIATALVREERGLRSPEEAPTAQPAPADAYLGAAMRRRRFLTWRNAVASFVVALAVWGVVATGWLVFGRRVEEHATVAQRPSVAVLPLVNRSGLEEDRYFTDGMHDEILTQLSRISGLSVRGRTSVMQYRDRPKNLREIGRELNARYLLEGGVQRAGEAVRINLQLIDSETDEHVLAETYDRELSIESLLAVQRDVALRIAEVLAATLTPDERERIERKPTDNLEAYDSYLLGRHYWNQRTQAGIERSIMHFRGSIQLDPNYAQAHAGLADAYSLLAAWRIRAPHEVYPRARAAARRALEIDDELGEAHISLAWVHYAYEWDWPAAEAAFRRGLELSPQYATGRHWYGFYLTTMGRFDEATAEFARARELDPLSRIIDVQMGMPKLYGGRVGEAVEHCESARARYPTFEPVSCGAEYLRLGRYEDAIAEFQVRSGQVGEQKKPALLGMAYALAGREEDARAVLSDLETRAKTEYISPAALAYIYVGLGQPDSALHWLGVAFNARAHEMVFLSVDPLLDPLRSDPRFQDLLRHMNQQG